MKNNQRGFTLIEVLLALAIIAIALTALLRASSQTTHFTFRVKSRMIQQWVAMEGLSSIQLGLINPTPGRVNTFKTEMLDNTWYWRVHLSETPLKNVKKIQITTSSNRTGPFANELIGYKYG